MRYKPKLEIPEWLNPAVIPPAELRDRLKVLHDRFMLELRWSAHDASYERRKGNYMAEERTDLSKDD